MPYDTTIIVRSRVDKERLIKDAIFAFSGGRKSILIKGEGQEISTAVEVAEILKNRMYPGIVIADVSLGSRPYYQRRNDRNKRRNPRYNKFKKDLISNIEILLKSNK